MSTHRPRRIDWSTAERLLEGDARVGADRLSDLLAAAAAPGRESELAGERAAMAAFRDTRLATVPRPRRRPMIQIAVVKIAAVAVAAIGGIAVAAAAGALPGQHRDEAPIPQHHNQVVSTTATATTTEKTKDNTPAPNPSLKGLCQAYTSGAGSEHGKKHDNPAFAALVAAAGGEDKIPAFCAGLLGDKQEKPGQTKDKPNR